MEPECRPLLETDICRLNADALQPVQMPALVTVELALNVFWTEEPFGAWSESEGLEEQDSEQDPALDDRSQGWMPGTGADVVQESRLRSESDAGDGDAGPKETEHAPAQGSSGFLQGPGLIRAGRPEPLQGRALQDQAGVQTNQGRVLSDGPLDVLKPGFGFMPGETRQQLNAQGKTCFLHALTGFCRLITGVAPSAQVEHPV